MDLELLECHADLCGFALVFPELVVREILEVLQMVRVYLQRTAAGVPPEEVVSSVPLGLN
jgi:hypothetical protein